MSSRPPAPVPQELVATLVAEAAKKSRVCWLSWPGMEEQAPRLVWHGWHDGALVVLSGDEQELAGIGTATAAEVVMRSKDTGGRLVGWTGSVFVVDPSSPAWDEHAAVLLGVRLNLPDPAAALARWREAATIVRIVPVDATRDHRPGPLP